MINLLVDSPEELWVKLGSLFFEKITFKEAPRPPLIDYSIAKRRFFSFNNVLTVNKWPKEWNNPLLFNLVGYSETGTKMTLLRDSYLNTEKWEQLKQAVYTWRESAKGNRIKSFGMPFNMKPSGKGGCLASFHVTQVDNEVNINIHMKIAEVPRKFMADLIFIGSLIKELNLPNEDYKVTFMLSNIYYSIIGLRAYVPILGRNNMDFKGLPIEEERNYQVNAQEGIYQAREKLFTKYGSGIMEKGLGPLPEIALIEGRS